MRDSEGTGRGARRILWVLLLAASASACESDRGSHRGEAAPAAEPDNPGHVGEIFSDRTAATGLDFVHFNGMSGELYIVEMMGPGGALFDHDNDGDLDLWLRQGVMLGPGKTVAGAEPMDRLYRNDLEISADGSRTLRFTDVTGTLGVRVSDYGMGVATGDYDNDGWIDLYLTNFGPNRMLRNNGDGTFEDVTTRTGTEDDRWSVPAVFADLDRDGWLDLYVANYIDFSPANHRECFRPSSALDYCGPLSYRAQPDRLFRNRGDGTFEDVTAASGLASSYGNALGAVILDFDSDGLPDIYVANDAMDNQLWLNQGGFTFTEDALIRGCALNARGEKEGSMGVTAGDFDGDRDPDLFLTHMAMQTNTLYVNDGRGSFDDDTLVAGLGAPSGPYTGFGTAWLDFDNDGWLDLMTVNGAVTISEELERAGDPFPLGQSDQLFRNLRDGTFAEVSEHAGPAFGATDVGRGAVFGDVDNDGDTDVVVVNNNGPARLLLNQSGERHPWLGIVLRSADGRPVTHGARIELARRDRTTVRWAGTDGSYCSASDPRVLIGLGDERAVTRARVSWPSGRTEGFAIDAVETYVTLVEGQGSADGLR